MIYKHKNKKMDLDKKITLIFMITIINKLPDASTLLKQLKLPEQQSTTHKTICSTI